MAFHHHDLQKVYEVELDQESITADFVFLEGKVFLPR